MKAFTILMIAAAALVAGILCSDVKADQQLSKPEDSSATKRAIGPEQIYQCIKNVLTCKSLVHKAKDGIVNNEVDILKFLVDLCERIRAPLNIEIGTCPATVSKNLDLISPYILDVFTHMEQICSTDNFCPQPK